MLTSPLKTAVVGVGHFGQYHAEKLARVPGSTLIAVADINRARADEIAARHGVAAVGDYRKLLGHVDAVSVATPAKAHYEVAKAFLEHGAHVLVEKPITDDLEHASHLIQVARDRGRILQVGHLERFSAAEQRLRQTVSRPIYIETSRLGFHPRGNDVNAVLDLMIHDLDLVLGIVNAPIEWVHAVGAPVVSHSEDIASCRIQFANGCVTNLTTSRISLRRERVMRIFQPNSYTYVDFLNKKMRILKRLPDAAGSIVTEESDHLDSDILELQISAFLGAVRTGDPPAVTGEDGRRALEAALMINRSLQDYWRDVHDRHHNGHAAPADDRREPADPLRRRP